MNINDVKCLKCDTIFEAKEGGGFFFHTLHCDKCGRDKGISPEELGEIHLRYVKGLKMPYSLASADNDKYIQENYTGEPIDESEYKNAIEHLAGKCPCGGRFSLTARSRCPKCHSDKYKVLDTKMFLD